MIALELDWVLKLQTRTGHVKTRFMKKISAQIAGKIIRNALSLITELTEKASKDAKIVCEMHKA
jgi:hypothetical protein